jgi:hypothetical protein
MDLYNKFKQDAMSSTIGESKAFVLTKAEAIKLTGEYIPKSLQLTIQ